MQLIKTTRMRFVLLSALTVAAVTLSLAIAQAPLPDRPLPAQPPWTQNLDEYYKLNQTYYGPQHKLPPPPYAGSPPSPTGLPGVYHPYPNPFPQGTIIAQCTTDDTIVVSTGHGIFPTPYVDPFTRPPGTNLLPSVYTNVFDLQGNEIVNTLPSTPTIPYNLHDGEPTVVEINQTSPTDDLHSITAEAERIIAEINGLQETLKNPDNSQALIDGINDEIALLQQDLITQFTFGVKIIEGEPLEVDTPDGKRVLDRAYAGLPLLHYKAVEQVKGLQPIYDDNGNVVSANVDVKQLWYDSHIETDTAYFNLAPVNEIADVEELTADATALAQTIPAIATAKIPHALADVTSSLVAVQNELDQEPNVPKAVQDVLLYPTNAAGKPTTPPLVPIRALLQNIVKQLTKINKQTAQSDAKVELAALIDGVKSVNTQLSSLPKRLTQLQDVPWTISYKLNVLNRGHDDFSPFADYVQKYYNPNQPPPAVLDPKTGKPKMQKNPTTGKEEVVSLPLPKTIYGMDASFFPMEDGTQTTLKLKMGPARYFNLVYTWGWRMHPPRIQATEHTPKTAGFFRPTSEPPENWNEKFNWATNLSFVSEESLGCKKTDLVPMASGAEQKAEYAAGLTKEKPEVKSLLDWERDAFCKDPTNLACKPSDDKAYAFEQISVLSPAKRMWSAFGDAVAATSAPKPDYDKIATFNEAARSAWYNWHDRTKLPPGIQVYQQGQEPGTAVDIQDSPIWDDADLIIIYVNNTIYGQFTDGALRKFYKWKVRNGAVNHVPPPPDNLNRLPKQSAGQQSPDDSILHLVAINGDHFDHGYQNADFGGSRGWENQFKSSVKVGGSGCWFTFGRTHWWLNLPGGAVKIPAAGKVTPSKAQYRAVTSESFGSVPLGMQRLRIVFNYEPSVRLRFYQFDPMHHNVNIFSQH